MAELLAERFAADGAVPHGMEVLMAHQGKRLLRGSRGGVAVLLAGLGLSLLPGCMPLAGAISTATTVLWGGIVYMPLRSLVGTVLRQFIVGG